MMKNFNRWIINKNDSVVFTVLDADEIPKMDENVKTNKRFRYFKRWFKIYFKINKAEDIAKQKI